MSLPCSKPLPSLATTSHPTHSHRPLRTPWFSCEASISYWDIKYSRFPLVINRHHSTLLFIQIHSSILSDFSRILVGNCSLRWINYMNTTITLQDDKVYTLFNFITTLSLLELSNEACSSWAGWTLPWWWWILRWIVAWDTAAAILAKFPRCFDYYKFQLHNRWWLVSLLGHH